MLLSNANPIGKIVYYALRIEFQMRGSPHLHSLIWTSDCPQLKDGNEEEYIRSIDEHVQGVLPNRNNKMPIEHKTARLTINPVRESQSMTALSYHERDSSHLRSFS